MRLGNAAALTVVRRLQLQPKRIRNAGKALCAFVIADTRDMPFTARRVVT
jgi:hypothetical protein